MSDFYANARSNYFKVKNPTKFKEFCQKYELGIIENDKDKTKVGFTVDADKGRIPDGEANSKGDYVEINFAAKLAKHLVDGEVAIIIEAGSDSRMNYINGYAVAVNSNGRTVVVSTDDIYNKAEKAFKTKTITRAEY